MCIYVIWSAAQEYDNHSFWETLVLYIFLSVHNQIKNYMKTQYITGKLHTKINIFDWSQYDNDIIQYQIYSHKEVKKNSIGEFCWKRILRMQSIKCKFKNIFIQ